jgi:hypothetical protein
MTALSLVYLIFAAAVFYCLGGLTDAIIHLRHIRQREREEKDRER